jgi:hypothetical protein
VPPSAEDSGFHLASSSDFHLRQTEDRAV